MHRIFSSQAVARLLVASTIFLSPALVCAQPSDPLKAVSMDDLERDANRSRAKFNELFKGATALDLNDQEQVKALDTAARYTLYRFWDVRVEKPVTLGSVSIDHVFQDFEVLQLKVILENKEKNMGVPQLFTKLMIQHAKIMLETHKPIARLNTARVLEKLTKLAQPELADALVEILAVELEHDAKPQTYSRNDGVKVYVLRGLGEMLALQEQNPPVLKKEQEEKIVVALTQFVERKPPLEKNAPQDEIDGARALRREAVRALANGRLATVDGKDKVRPGLALLRVMARDGVQGLEPRMDERVEAAIGVARLLPARDKSFQQEYAAYQLAYFVEALASHFGKAKEDKKPFNTYAARLFDAMEGMKANKPPNDPVTKVVDQCGKVLQMLENAKDSTNNATVTFLDNWLSMNPAKKDSLYEGVKDATVKPANRADADGPPEK